MELRTIPISELKFAEYNPREISKENFTRLRTSIKEFGFTVPCTVNSHPGRENVLIAGHMRTRASQEEGMTEIPCWVVDLDENRERMLNVALNNPNLQGDWDEQKLAELFVKLNEEDANLRLTGFDEGEVVRLLRDYGPDENEAEPEVNIPDAAESKLGEVYELGRHRLMCGDSTDPHAVEVLMCANKAEILFTSPPYSDMREYNGEKDLTIDNLARFIESFDKYVKYQIVNLGIQRKNDEIFEYWNEYITKARSIGLKLLSWNVWEQDGAGSIGKQKAFFPIAHEWIFVFGREPKEINRTIAKTAARRKRRSTHQMKDGSIDSHSTGVQTTAKQMETVVYVPQEKTKIRDEHPAIFPVELAESFIYTMTNEGDSVIDPFGGSGSTLIAAEKTGRTAYLMELDPRYCDVIRKRYKNYVEKAQK